MDSEYQPDGWIDKLIGTNARCHRFCTHDDMNSNIQTLVDDLGDKGKTGAVKAIGTYLFIL